MSLNAILGLLVPPLTKALLKSYLGAEVAGVAGSAGVIALKHFTDRGDAKKAENAAKNLARALLDEIRPWIETELQNTEDYEFYIYELVDTIDRGFSEKAAIDSLLDPKILCTFLIENKKYDWEQSGTDANHILSRLVEIICEPLCRLVPSLPQYAYERDHLIISSLSNISSSVSSVLSGQKLASELVEKLVSEPEKIWQKYEDSYRSAMSKNLDYVEILGLGLKREDRLAALNAAYLSLTVDDASSEDEDVLRFEDVLALLPLRDNRLIVEGGAGSGKSTLLRWAAIYLADSNRLSSNGAKLTEQRIEGGAIRFLERSFRARDIKLDALKMKEMLVPGAGAPSFQAGEFEALALSYDSIKSLAQRFFTAEHAKEGPTPKPVPFLVRLRDLKGGSFPDLDGLAKTAVDVGSPPPGWVSSILDSGRAVVLVDGVDEVSEEHGARASIMAAIRRLSKTFPKNTFIVAGRPGAFTSPPFDVDQPLRVLVNDMDDGQRQVFVKRWHAAKSERQNTLEARNRVADNAAKLQAELDQNSALRRMASNPLLAASICALHDLNPSTVPRNEYELCERLAKMLVNERDMTDDESGHRVDLEHLGHAYALDYADKRTVISRIAGQMLNTGESLLSWSECKAVVASVIPSLNTRDSLTPDALLAALAIRSGVLRQAINRGRLPESDQSGHEAIEFVHNRFKEWFASINYRDRQQPTELANKLPDDPYDQIAIFSVSASGAESFSNELMKVLQQRVSKEISSKRRALKLTAVRVNDAAQVLSPDLRSWATSMHRDLFPPKSRLEARALSLLGDTAVPFLRHKTSWSAKQAALAAYCLKSIGTQTAAAALSGYNVDERWTVALEAFNETHIAKSQALRKRLFSGKSITGIIGAKLRSLENFSDIARLTKLNLASTSFYATTSLSGAAKLKDLDLSNTPVVDIMPLAVAGGITRLVMDRVPVKDFSPLARLKLAVLSLHHTAFSELSDLGEQEELFWLRLSQTKLDDIEGIQKYRGLVTISIGNTKVSNFLPLAELSKLKHVHLDRSASIDLSCLSSAQGIETLSASRSVLSNFNALSSLKKVKSIDVSYTNIPDTSFISNMTNLTLVNIDQTPVTSLEGIRGARSLSRLDMDRTEIRDLSPLTDMPKLTTIFARSNIDDFSPLLSCPSLKYVCVSPEAEIDQSAFSAREIRVVRASAAP